MSSEWLPIETAPKGGGAEMVTDPLWVAPPRILMNFGSEGMAIVYYDWYYAEGGNGYDGANSPWVVDKTSETADQHFNCEPDGWMPLPPPPEAGTVNEGEKK
jgi:hypothetical protein